MDPNLKTIVLRNEFEEKNYIFGLSRQDISETVLHKLLDFFKTL